MHRFSQELSILIVGHEPYLTNMICEAIFLDNKTTSGTGAGLGGGIIFKNAGLAKIRLFSMTPNIGGELRWVVTSRITKLLEDGSKLKENRKSEKVL